MGFDARWGVLGAADVGANHQRDRIWIVAKFRGQLSHTQHNRIRRWEQQQEGAAKEIKSRYSKWQLANTNLRRYLHGQTEINPTKGRIDALGEFGASGSNVAHTSGKGRKSDKHVGNIDGREICRPVSQQGENGREQSLVNANSKGLEESHNNPKVPKWIQQESSQRCAEIPNATSLGLSGQRQHEQPINPAPGRERQTTKLVYGCSPDFWAVEPNVGRVADGVAARVDRLKAIGNGQVPLCAATAWRILNQ
jgi:DNA (cytosine-5)-methyltransferase 1